MAYMDAVSDAPLITVAETKLVVRQAAAIWPEAERFAFIDHIAANPESGAVIPGSGGIRKLRWSKEGQGKRGGVQVIYFYHNPFMPVYLFLV